MLFLNASGADRHASAAARCCQRPALSAWNNCSQNSQAMNMDGQLVYVQVILQRPGWAGAARQMQHHQTQRPRIRAASCASSTVSRTQRPRASASLAAKTCLQVRCSLLVTASKWNAMQLQ